MISLTALLRWLPALSMMALIFMFSSLPSSAIPDLGFLDSMVQHAGHFLGYALLGLAYYFGLTRRASGRTAYLLAIALALLYALTDEFHQSFVPGRSPSWLDIGIDSLGASTAVFLMRRYSPNSSSNPSSSSKP